MKNELKKELPLLLIISIPFIYLAFIWNDLPAKVPVHWNMEGEVNRYGNKLELLIIPFLLPFLMYMIFIIVPQIDPKKKIDAASKKYQNLKFLLTSFMSALAIYLIFSIKNETLGNPNILILLLGFLYFILGNYFKTIKANYFIGIRTPLTLENESVWKTTHAVAGKLWFVGGILVIILSLILSHQTNLIVFLVITGIITVIPMVHSYVLFKKLPAKNNAE